MSDKSNTKIFHQLQDGSIMTAEGRLFYSQYLHTANENKQGKLIHSLELCLPPETDLKPLKNLLAKVALENCDGNKEQAKKFVEKKLLNPCDLPNGGNRGNEFEGWTLIRANSSYCPDFVWPNGQRMSIDEVKQTIKSGFWVRATLNAYWFKNPENRGVTLGLRNVQFLKPGPVIGFAKPDGEDEFGAIEGTENSSKKPESKSDDIDELFTF